MPTRGPTDQAEVLVVGTFHMNNPGLDAINLEVDDVLAAHRQVELEDLAARIGRFGPTKVCVECLPSRQPALDAQYTDYVKTGAAPDRNEVYQVAFRVARLCGIERVHGIDDDTPMDWAGFTSYMEENPKEAKVFQEEIAAAQLEAKKDSKRLLNTPIRQFLLAMNDEPALRKNLDLYMDVMAMGGVGDHRAADMTASWYHRNIRIFSNLSGLTEPGDRMFVLMGHGHVPILRHLVDASSRHRMVDAAEFLR